jgi:hypothetical protein
VEANVLHFENCSRNISSTPIGSSSSLSDSDRSTAPLLIGIGRSRSPSSIRASVIVLSTWGTTIFLKLDKFSSYDRCLSLPSSCRRRRAKSDRLLDLRVCRRIDERRKSTSN